LWNVPKRIVDDSSAAMVVVVNLQEVPVAELESCEQGTTVITENSLPSTMEIVVSLRTLLTRTARSVLLNTTSVREPVYEKLTGASNPNWSSSRF